MSNNKPSCVLEQMMDAVYYGRGLDGLVELASELIGNPVYITDISDRFIAAPEQLKSSNTYMRSMLEAGHANESEISRMQRSGLKRIIFESTGPFMQGRDSGQVHIFSPIRLFGEAVAFVCILNLNREFEEKDLELASIITKAISIELQKSRIYQDKKGTLLGYQLLDAIHVDRNVFPEYSVSLNGWVKKKYAYLLCIDFSESAYKTQQKIDVLMRTLHNTLAEDIVALDNNRIIVLLNQNQDFRPGTQKYDRIREYL